jgi:hypothetical protein
MTRDPDAPAGLSRWSRLKLAAHDPAPEAEEEVEPEPEAPIVAPDPALEDLPEAEVLERLGLPDPDLMQAGDDFSAFMQRTVPEFLRRRALRRLWLSNPVLANLDGLIDHGEDYTDAATVQGGMKTLYEIGRGIRLPVSTDEIVDPEMAEADATAPFDCDAAEPEVLSAEKSTPEKKTAHDTDQQITQVLAPADPVPLPEIAPSRRRRMTFDLPS